MSLSQAKKENRTVGNSWKIIVSLLLSLLALLGETVSKTTTLDLLFSSKITFLISLVYWAGCAAFIYCFINFIVFLVHKMLSTQFAVKISKLPFPNAAYLFLILLILWIPLGVYLLPSTIGYDGARQINEFFNVSIPGLNFTYFPTNHHPWFATLVMGGIFKLGLFLFHSHTAAFYTHSFFLVTFSLFAYSGLISRIRRIAGSYVGWLVLLFLGLEPHFVAYAVCFDKTGWFLASSALFVTYLLDLLMLSDKKVRSSVFLTLATLLVCLFRNNGVYVTLVTLLVAFICMKESRRFLGAVLIVSLLFYEGWTRVFLTAFKVMPSSPAEMLVVPIQQTSFVVTRYPNILTKQDKKAINDVMYYRQIPRTYQPSFGDSAKNLFRYNSFLITAESIQDFKKNPNWWKNNIYKQRVHKYLLSWFVTGLKHPLLYLNATLDNQFLSIDPIPVRSFNTADPYGSASIYTGIPSDTYFVINSSYLEHVQPLVPSKQRIGLTNYLNIIMSIPLLNLFMSTALWNWLAISLLIYFIATKNKMGIIFTVPSLLTFLINLDGSVNGDHRYAIPIEIMLLVSLAVIKRNDPKQYLENE
ncbi:MAG: DUF6020 family protein [Oenococcus sp.]